MPPREAFLSHSSEDRAMARRIAEMLGDHGVPTFYAPANVIGHIGQVSVEAVRRRDFSGCCAGTVRKRDGVCCRFRFCTQRASGGPLNWTPLVGPRVVGFKV